MKLKLALIATAAACTLYSTGAAAQDVQPEGFYLGVNAGIANLGETDVRYYDEGGALGGTGTQDTLDLRFDFDSSITFGGVIGYDFGAIRSDLELSYAKNDLSSFTFVALNGQTGTLDADEREELCDFLETDTCAGSGNTITASGGGARQINAMLNVWGELPIGPVTPYAGGGIGIGGFEVDGEGDAKFAWQLGAGAALNISPNFAITVDYRHRRVSGTQIEWDDVSGVVVDDLKTDTITAGLRVYL